MANFDLIKRLARAEGGKIVLLVMDGLGGLPMEPGGLTELEAAHTPNLDRLAKEGCLGLSHPVARGIEPGSGPGHLGLFGYDPLIFDVGRGALEASGVGLAFGPGDVVARGNFCTVDENGIITDRRAGRIPSEQGAAACAALRTISLPGVELTIDPVKEYRFAFKLHGQGLSAEISETDPQDVGLAPLPSQPLDGSKEAAHTAELINQFTAQAAQVLKDHHPANMLTLRGFASDPGLPRFAEIYKLRPACVAVYPMYKGISRLIGFDIIETKDDDKPADEFAHVKRIWNDYDFIFVHVKYTDSRGEDGDFAAKAAVIEQVDAALPALLDLAPDVLMVTGDHSTPARLKSHSFHPVPVLLHAPAFHMPDHAERFGEREAISGGLGQFPAAELMQLAMAHAGRLNRYGA